MGEIYLVLVLWLIFQEIFLLGVTQCEDISKISIYAASVKIGQLFLFLLAMEPVPANLTTNSMIYL